MGSRPRDLAWKKSLLHQNTSAAALCPITSSWREGREVRRTCGDQGPNCLEQHFPSRLQNLLCEYTSGSQGNSASCYMILMGLSCDELNARPGFLALQTRTVLNLHLRASEPYTLFSIHSTAFGPRRPRFPQAHAQSMPNTPGLPIRSHQPSLPPETLPKPY